MAEPLLRAERLTVGFARTDPLIRNVNLSLNAGEIIAITGPSGIGKTTLLRTLAGLLPPLEGVVIHPRGGSSAKRGELGYIPQRLGLVRHASVQHNVVMGALTGATSRFWPFSADARVRSHEAIAKVGLAGKLHMPIRKLSGGQQRRVATARALAQRPRVLLADEFLGELDQMTMEIVRSSVVDYVRDHNAALLMIEHNLDRAITIADRVLHVDGEELTRVVL